MKQVVIAFDQFINTLIWAKGEGFGKADETISARAWRLEGQSKLWKVTRVCIDYLFSVVELDHCKKSYLSELTRNHLPEEYQRLSEEQKAEINLYITKVSK